MSGKVTALPAPSTKGKLSLEETLLRRRSVRRFQSLDLKPEQLGQLLWAGQGITDVDRGRRTAPSAGALYPITLYLVTKEGVYSYLPAGHKLVQLTSEDRRVALGEAALQQPWVATAPATLVIAGDPDKLRGKYGARSERYLCLEAGHIAQNVLLEAVALGLGSVPVGAFSDSAVTKAVGLPAGEQPVYLLPVGHPESN